MNQNKRVLPYLGHFAVPRTENASIEGRYSCETAMWMVGTDDCPQPIIESNRDLLELITKTYVKQETDD